MLMALVSSTSPQSRSTLLHPHALCKFLLLQSLGSLPVAARLLVLIPLGAVVGVAAERKCCLLPAWAPGAPCPLSSRPG
eukprot:10012545-Prorocentrum_lima.AAC.1